jgi:hypothetical protein
VTASPSVGSGGTILTVAFSEPLLSVDGYPGFTVTDDGNPITVTSWGVEDGNLVLHLNPPAENDGEFTIGTLDGAEWYTGATVVFENDSPYAI